MDDIEKDAIKRIMQQGEKQAEEQKTVANDPEFSARVERLQERLREKYGKKEVKNDG